MFSGSIEAWRSTIPESGREDSATDLKQLAQIVAEKRACLLCGSGMSKASGMPLAKDLSIMMTNMILHGERPQLPPTDELKYLASIFPMETIAEAYQKEFDQDRLRAFLSDEFDTDPATLHEGHRALEFLASQGYIDRVYTTNFDFLIEEAVGGRGKTISDSNVNELKKALTLGQMPVLHLHGHLGTDCLLEESKTYKLETPLSQVLKADMTTSYFVFIGYSLNDPDLRTIYLSIRDTLQKEKLAKKPFVVHPLLADSPDAQRNELRLASAVWDARHATYIPGKAELLLPALARQVHLFKADNLAREIVRKRGGNPASQEELDNLWKEAEKAAKKTGLGDEVQAMEVIAQAEGAL